MQNDLADFASFAAVGFLISTVVFNAAATSSSCLHVHLDPVIATVLIANGIPDRTLFRFVKRTGIAMQAYDIKVSMEKGGARPIRLRAVL